MVVNGLRLLSAGLLMAGLSCQLTQSDREVCHSRLDHVSRYGDSKIKSACMSIALGVSCQSPMVPISNVDTCRKIEDMVLLSCLYEFMVREDCNRHDSRTFSARF